MSTQLTHDEIESTTTTDTTDEQASNRVLFRWLDEQPNFITVERTKRVRSKDSGTATQYGTRDKDVMEGMFVHPDYDITSRASHGTQSDVMQAWEDMEFPSHRIESVQGLTGAYHYTRSSAGGAPFRRGWGRRRSRTSSGDTETTINFDAVQHPAGHGVVQHYSTIAAIRTKNGLVIQNEQDFGGGFAKVTTPSDRDEILPLTGIDDLLSGHSETLYDIVEVQRDSTPIRKVRSYEDGEYRTTGYEKRLGRDQPLLVHLSTGAAVMLLIDTTANNSNERKCGFYLPPEEAAIYDSVEAVENSLQPVAVQQAVNAGHFDITTADEYAGDGATFGDESRLGDTIIRQGEWYLVPMPEGWMPETPVYKALPNANRKSRWEFDHLDIDLGPEVDIGSLPETSCTCGKNHGDDWTIDNQYPMATCDNCGTNVIYDTLEEDAADFLDWERPADALDTLGSHTPRDLAVEDDSMFVRGTFRHTDQEHQMVNLKDRWHVAIENTRDVTVFDLNLDRGGTARVE